MLTIENVKKSFGKKDVLKGISLSFEEGKVYGIVGDNGAGKTTLFRCIADLELFDGKISYTANKLKSVLGFLPTSPYFMSKITGEEYLTLFCNARSIRINNLQTYNIFELPLNEYAETYSTGMKKKLALTAVLLQQNEVFILDEPFNGVDIHSNILIEEVILKLKSLNKIVILSSHIFSTLADTCDILHLLKEGKIINTASKNTFFEIENIMKETSISSKIDNLK